MGNVNLFQLFFFFLRAIDSPGGMALSGGGHAKTGDRRDWDVGQE
jgi:hypothetical protein